jgi:acyl carrier protein
MQNDTPLEITRGILAKNAGGRFSAAAIRDDLRLAQDLGIDSLKFILVILELEEQLGRKIFDVDNVKRLTTVGDLCGLVEAAAQAAQRGRTEPRDG